jgi:ABC-2 type transport system ATP-binding protein
MITIEELNFWYLKQNRVFEKLNLHLEAGHIYGLMGKNGAGKTTLLKLVCGLSFPKSGVIRLDGRIPGKRAPGFLKDIFFVPEEISFPSVILKKFVEIHAGFYPAFDPDRFNEALERFAVDGNRNCDELSYGQKKKAIIAFALAAGTRYIFLDEPTSGLDIPSKAALRSMLAETFSGDKTIILSTHMVRDLESLIDRVIILDNRRMILNRSLDQVSRKLTFSHSSPETSVGEILYSFKGELGPTIISLNPEGLEGKVELEALFTACINIPDRISNCFEQ